MDTGCERRKPPALQPASGRLVLTALLLGGGWLGLVVRFSEVRATGPMLRRSVPACLVLGGLLWLSAPAPSQNMLLRLRFELSRSALTAAAEEALRERRAEQSVWIGIFPVSRTMVHYQGVDFFTSECGRMNACGITYSPAPLRPSFNTDYTSLGEGWYVFESF